MGNYYPMTAPTALLAQEAKRERERETESIGLSRNMKTKTTKRRRSRREQNRVYKALKHKGKEQA
jgi:hypothetical protein